MNYQLYPTLAKVALGEVPADIVIKNTLWLDVFNEEWVKGDIAIHQGYVVGTGSYSGTTEIDGTGKFVVPGFVDSHLHLESTLVNPSELIFAATQFGTTSFIVDPHEAGNVKGIQGVEFMIQETEDAQGRVFVMAPSCVPAIEGEETGCIMEADALLALKKNPRILGIGEVMDVNRVVNGNHPMLAKLEAFSDRVLDGHIIGLSDKLLQAFVLAGIRTNHECGTYEEAKEQIRNGVQVLIREGSAAKNIEAIVTGIVANKANCDGYGFCTDDKHIEDIKKDGHISYNIRKAISLGLDPIQAFKMASYNTYKTYRMHDLGAIAPGYKADLVMLDDVENVRIHKVFIDGEAVRDTYIHEKHSPEHLMHTVNMGPISEKQLRLATDGTEPIINIIPGQIVTQKTVETVPVKDGYFQPNNVYNKITCIERHHGTGHNGVGILKGYGITNGAIATSVAHDAHNVIVVGDNDKDMMIAIERIAEIGGGYVIVRDGQVADELPLEIMGLITNQPHQWVDQKVKDMQALAHEMGVAEGIDPFINLSFLCLTVIPEIRITTKGVVQW